ncbi:MAG: SpoVG family protein [Oscillospiraceae bacterium]|jgi:stage V sporulation protein G|nr:SpoVG family protein [Oscillospiraceae bacterium]
MAGKDGIKLNVRAYPIAEPKNSIVAYASITIADLFAVNNIRVVDSAKGLFVAMPQVKDSSGQYRDICFPVTAEMRRLLNDAVLGAYALAQKEAAAELPSATRQIRDGRRAEKNGAAQTKEETSDKTEPEL